jgi:hypothetical protein
MLEKVKTCKMCEMCEIGEMCEMCDMSQMFSIGRVPPPTRLTAHAPITLPLANNDLCP